MQIPSLLHAQCAPQVTLSLMDLTVVASTGTRYLTSHTQLSPQHTEQPLAPWLVLKVAKATLSLKVSLLAVPSTWKGPALDSLIQTLFFFMILTI